ncbi:PspC domain-containing protein [Jonesia quinghaiensis]|uniref:PspC domain-containing protein n=1 Tax=Jonesia quinghaiensis TaxID=262806 RepID=UPI000408B184|nr:PspC domain-containing protein [Jonesia quinghaiensis]
MDTNNPSPPVGGQQFFNSIRASGFYRTESRWVGGVAGGVAARLRVDPLVIRAAFIIALIVLTGISFVLYAAAWLLLPEERDGRIHLEQAFRGDFNGALVGIGLLTIFGLGSADSFFLFGQSSGPFAAVFWLIIIGLVIWGVYQYSQQNKPPTPPSGAGPSYGYGQTSSGFGPGPSAPTYGPENRGAPTMPLTSNSESSNSASAPVEGDAGAAPGTNEVPPTAPLPTGQTQWNGPTTSPAPSAWQAPEPNEDTSNPYGGPQFALLIGVMLLIVAGTLWAESSGTLASYVDVIALLSGIGLVLGGIAVVTNGIRGYASGSSGFFSVVALIAALISTGFLMSGVTFNSANTRVVGDSTVVPTSLNDAADGYAFGIGDFVLDLTELPTPDADDQPLRIPISGGIGEVEIIVPNDVAVTGNNSVGVGETTQRRDDGTASTTSGIGVGNAEYNNTLAEEGTPAVFELDISIGIGAVTITEETS